MKPTPEQVTMRAVAEALGLSQGAVSLALRGRPGVGADTREKVKAAAAAMGYRLDPVTSALAERRWRGPGRRVRQNWAVLGDREADAGARRRKSWDSLEALANAQGWGLTRVVWRAGLSAEGLRRVLRARGVSGVIVQAEQGAERLAEVPAEHALWEECAWVAVDERRALPMHTVRFNTFDNTRENLRRIHEAGYRRVGVLLAADQGGRVPREQHGAVLQWAAEHPANAPQVFHFEEGWTKIIAGLRAAKVDALLLAYPALRDALPDWLRALPWASLGKWEPNPAVAGMVKDRADAYRQAVELLDLQCRQGRRGMPERRLLVLVEGRWEDGISLPPAEV